MLLKAPSQLNAPSYNEEVIFDAETLDRISEKVEMISLPQALVKERAGPRDIARTVGDILHNGASDNVRLRAAQLASELGGYGSNKEASTISIIINDSNVNLNSLFCPAR